MLCPQHWAQAANDHVPKPMGTFVLNLTRGLKCGGTSANIEKPYSTMYVLTHLPSKLLLRLQEYKLLRHVSRQWMLCTSTIELNCVFLTSIAILIHLLIYWILPNSLQMRYSLLPNYPLKMRELIVMMRLCIPAIMISVLPTQINSVLFIQQATKNGGIVATINML